MKAAEEGYVDCVHALLDFAADIDAHNWKGRT
jgi:hypothetical protein